MGHLEKTMTMWRHRPEGLLPSPGSRQSRNACKAHPSTGQVLAWIVQE